jgi:conjugative relaxase-like TrwC/TraI family protein
MLRVTTIHAHSAAASARYYTHYLTGDGPDAEGHWLGRRAGAIGLGDKRVETDELEALLSGHHPVTGSQLGYPLRDRVDRKGKLIPAVAGFDATFSAPKSLSVWWGLTGDAGLLEAHDLAVRAVLDHLEEYGATTRIRVDDRRQHPDVDGLIMAAFPQATSREDDPQLHTHVVISAKVLAPDGRWLALDGRYLKRKQRALGGLYQSVLRAELTSRYGVAWGPIEKGQAEIAGMPKELLDAFSKRTAQVDAALADKITDFREREGRDPTRWERAALTREASEDTRAKKTHATHGDLGSHWRDRAKARGWTPARLVERMRDAARTHPTPEPPTVVDVIEQLSAAGSAWHRADVLQAVCDLTPPVAGVSGQRWAAAVERACDRVIETCTTLHPPSERSPRRASDGRSIWIAPIEPHLTTEGVLAQEERILLFAIDAHDIPARPSPTLDPTGLDVLQADAAAAVAGDDALVLVVGPAGTGKTTTLRRAAANLGAHGRHVFAVAPTAKAAKVLRDETGIPSATVAKLLHEWRSRQPSDEYRLPPGTTLIVDEAGMLGTGNLDALTQLAASQQWRLVLVGDPRQLQAVGRGGMFDELCRTGRVHELATIHRFRSRWEQAASLRLRAGSAEALDAYFRHGRVGTGTFEALAADAARQWIDYRAAGRSVAVVAETNEHVDALNHAIQELRRERGQLGDRAVNIAGGESAAVGDVVVTRRNNRELRTSRDEPVRNRDRWTVTAIGREGSLTVSHEHGHGHVSLPAEYTREHVRHGYAATAHGHQGDTVDVSLTVVTAATTHRSLYVGATRGRDLNRLLVVTEDPDLARDVLEEVLTNDRADLPAVAQRRHLAEQEPRVARETAEARVAAARRAHAEAIERAAPYMRPLRDAENDLQRAGRDLYLARRAAEEAPLWRRRTLTKAASEIEASIAPLRARVSELQGTAAPYVTEVEQADERVRDAEREASIARTRQRLDELARRPPARERGLGMGIEL